MLKNQMKRKITLILVAMLAVAMTLAATSCGKSEFGGADITDKHMTINATKADADMFFTSGSLVVDAGEQLVISPELESGAVQLKFISSEGMDDMENIPDEETPEPALTADVSGTEPQSYPIAAGTYLVSATVTEKATGTINIDVEQAEAGSWISATSAEEAGENAGVGLFMVDPQGTSLGAVTNADYSYMEGVAEAHFGLGAVEMFIRKGMNNVNEGDVSFDENEYANEWKHEHDGLEVTCYGNREGEATKTVWTAGDYSYAILAYGAGGDDDYGLSAEDLDTILSDIQ